MYLNCNHVLFLPLLSLLTPSRHASARADSVLLSARPAADAGAFIKTLLRRVSARDRAPDWSADGSDGVGSFTLGIAGTDPESGDVLICR